MKNNNSGAFVAALVMVAFMTLLALLLRLRPLSPKERGEKMLARAREIAGQFPWRVVDEPYLDGFSRTFLMASRPFGGGDDIVINEVVLSPEARQRYKGIEKGSYVMFYVDTSAISPESAVSPLELLRPRNLTKENPVNPYLLRL